MLSLLTHEILSLGSSSIIIALGAILQVIRIPTSNEHLKKLTIARNYLSLSYIVLAALGFLSVYLHEKVDKTLILIIASYQALLFTMTLLTFVQPLYVYKRRVFTQFALITLIGILLLTTQYLYPATLFPIIFYITIMGYIFQLVYYAMLFRTKYTICLKQLEDYYDEEENHRLEWVQFSFYSALGVGIMALLSIFIDGYLYYGFIIFYTTFYIYIAGRFHNYPVRMKFLIPAIGYRPNDNIPEESIQEVIQTDKQHVTDENIRAKVRLFENALDKWTNERGYCQKDIGVEEIAKLLGTDLTFLRYYFHTYMTSDFRIWRAELRIKEAQRLMLEEPDISLEQVRERTGFNHRANFHQTFKKITGQKPTEFRLNNRPASSDL